MSKTRRRTALILVSLLALAVLTVMLVVDVLVERVIEAKGSEVVGARVELSRVDISFFPLGAQLFGLQVADPDRPMRNALEVETLGLHIDARPLLARRVIIDDLAVTRLRFDTPRQTSGALPGVKGKEVDEAAGGLSGPGAGLSGFRIPDVKALLAQEDLRSVKLAESLKAEAEGRLKEWEGRLAQLPNEKTLKEYEDRIGKLGNTKGTVSGALGAAGEFQSLQGDISNSLNLLKAASKEFGADKTRFNNRLQELRQAPEADFRKLKDKYAVSVKGLGNLTKLFLEDSLRAYVDTALRWYSRFQPYLAQPGDSAPGGTGSSKRPKDQTAPSENGTGFLIRVATVSADLPWGPVNGRVENLTDNQRALGLPTVFELGGRGLEGLKAVTLKASYDEVKAAAASLAFNLLAEGYRISDLPISQARDLPIWLKEGFGNLDIKGSISGNRISSKVLFDVQDALFSSGKAGGGDDTSRMISSALQQLSHLTLSADISGTLSDYAVQLTSNLDGALRSAFETEVRRLAANFEKELLAGIRQRSSEHLGGATAAVSGLEGIGKSLEERSTLASGLLSSLNKGGAGGLKLPF